jgi:hypothetical protein
MTAPRKSTAVAKHTRCFTRALKNARYLQDKAPEVFARDPEADGFGTGVPVEILSVLHQTRHTSPTLNRHKAVANFLRTEGVPGPGRNAREALFSGTIHFAQITFQASTGTFVTATADMNQIVQYAQHAIAPISEYAVQYGANTLAVSPTLLTKTVNLSGTTYTDANLQAWVNQLAAANSLPSNSCIFVVSPPGVSAANVGGNAGYHGQASTPYIVAGVDSPGLTLADNADVYAMVVSHEIAEMVVDPTVDHVNPEVCDSCDLNCSNLTRCYFDANDNFLGSNQNSPPSGFSFAYYTCAVVTPANATDCPAPLASCEYAPGGGTASWTPTSLNYGTVSSGTPSLAVQVSNTGSGNLIVTNIASSESEFSANVGSLTVSAGQTGTISVTFRPLNLPFGGQSVGTLTFDTTDSAHPKASIPMSGSVPSWGCLGQAMRMPVVRPIAARLLRR